MQFATLITVTIFAATHSTGAWSADYEVRRTLQLSSSATEVWNFAGDFCDIDDWHPAIAACELDVRDGSLYRVLTTVDGGKFVEKRIAAEPGVSYTYRIESSPLPIDNYTATFSVEPLNGSIISWSSRFSSDDPSTEATIIGNYETGLTAIESGVAD